MGITHVFVSSKADGDDSSLVRPSDWNAVHTITNFGSAILVASSTASAATKAAALASGGSVCDGIADNVEIQAALDACAAIDVGDPGYLGAGEVYCSLGTFNIASTVLLRRNVRLLGTGAGYAAGLDYLHGTVFKLANGANCDILRNYNYPDSHLDWFIDVRNIALDGNKANNTSGKGISLGGTATLIPFIHLENIFAFKTVGSGFYFYAPNVVTLINPNALLCDGCGIECYGGYNYTIISPCVQMCGVVGEKFAIYFNVSYSNIFSIYLEDNYKGLFLAGEGNTINGLFSNTTTMEVGFEEDATARNNRIHGVWVHKANGDDESMICGGISSVYSGYRTIPTITGTPILLGSYTYIAPNESKIASGSLTAGVANAFAFAWQNPHAQAIMVTRVVIDVTTAGGTANSVIDVGSAATATTTSDNLIDGADLNAIAVYDNFGNPGANGKYQQKLAAKDGATDWVTGQILVANASNLVGKYYIYYTGI